MLRAKARSAAGAAMVAGRMRGIETLGLFNPPALELLFTQQVYRQAGKNYALANFPGYSFTRASTKWAPDSQGVLHNFASGVPAITDLGFLPEESRTNLFLNSFASATQTITLSATGNYTVGVWGSGSVAVAAGTATITNAGSASAGSPRTINCTATGTIIVTVTGSPTAVQVEAGAFGTSPIQTAGTSATRAADVLKITGLSFSGPVTLGYVGQGVPSSSTAYVHARLSDATSSNYFQIAQFSDTTHSFPQAVVGGVSQFSPVQGITAGSTFKTAAIADGAGRYQAATNGVLATAATGKSNLPTMSELDIGNAGGGSQINSFVKRLTVYAAAYSDTQLQALTQ